MFFVAIDFIYDSATGRDTLTVYSTNKASPIDVNELIYESIKLNGAQRLPSSINVQVSDLSKLIGSHDYYAFYNPLVHVYDFNAIPKEDSDLLESPKFSFLSCHSLCDTVPLARAYALDKLNAERLIVRGETANYTIPLTVSASFSTGEKVVAM